MSDTYKRHFIILHWLMFLLIVAAYMTIEFRGIFEKGTPERDLIKAVHYVLGLSVFLLLIARLSSKLLFKQPSTRVLNKFQVIISRVVFTCLYLFMGLMPILGWLLVSAEGHQVQLFNLTLPALISEDHELAKQIEEVHETIGSIGYALIGLHIIAGLAHHFLFKDDTLKRMLGKK